MYTWNTWQYIIISLFYVCHAAENEHYHHADI